MSALSVGSSAAASKSIGGVNDYADIPREAQVQETSSSMREPRRPTFRLRAASALRGLHSRFSRSARIEATRCAKEATALGIKHIRRKDTNERSVTCRQSADRRIALGRSIKRKRCTSRVYRRFRRCYVRARARVDCVIMIHNSATLITFFRCVNR